MGGGLIEREAYFKFLLEKGAYKRVALDREGGLIKLFLYSF